RPCRPDRQARRTRPCGSAGWIPPTSARKAAAGTVFPPAPARRSAAGRRTAGGGWSSSETPAQGQHGAATRSGQLLATAAVGKVFMVTLVQQVIQAKVNARAIQYAEVAEAIAQAGI